MKLHERKGRMTEGGTEGTLDYERKAWEIPGTGIAVGTEERTHEDGSKSKVLIWGSVGKGKGKGQG